MKNLYLVERFFGDMSNVSHPIAVMTNKKKAKKVLRDLNARGIISKISLNEIYDMSMINQRIYIKGY